jgi:hypothetical protein
VKQGSSVSTLLARREPHHYISYSFLTPCFISPFVVSSPQVNEDLDHRTLLRKYERELRRLRAELQQKSKDLVDKRLVLQVCAGAAYCRLAVVRQGAACLWRYSVFVGDVGRCGLVLTFSGCVK